MTGWFYYPLLLLALPHFVLFKDISLQVSSVLLGFSGKIGFFALIVVSISLFIQGHWFVGAIPLLLIGVNLLFLPRSHKQMIKKVIKE
jgi:hypothetical protein